MENALTATGDGAVWIFKLYGFEIQGAFMEKEGSVQISKKGRLKGTLLSFRMHSRPQI